MNIVLASLDKSDYPIYEDYLNFKIDNHFLDEIIQEYYPGPEFKGLVPTLLSWLDLIEERTVVWSRILPPPNSTTHCPILMCPDDCDFSCSLVICEIQQVDNRVIWKRFGLNRSRALDPEKIGQNVEWLVYIPTFEFELEAYKSMLETFKKELELSNT